MSVREGMGPGGHTLGGGGRISSEPSGVGQSPAPEHAGSEGPSWPTRASPRAGFPSRSPYSQIPDRGTLKSASAHRGYQGWELGLLVVLSSSLLLSGWKWGSF